MEHSPSWEANSPSARYLWSSKLLFVHAIILYSTDRGRAIAQAVSRLLPTAAARVRARVMSCAICGGQSGTGAGFLRALRFPLPILIPPTAPHSSSLSRGGTMGQIVADVPSGLSLTPPQETKLPIDQPIVYLTTLLEESKDMISK
jgi:hypothetical protein